jgi:hypothetical protein
VRCSPSTVFFQNKDPSLLNLYIIYTECLIARSQVLLIDSAFWAASAVGSDRLLSALVSAKRNKKM